MATQEKEDVRTLTFTVTEYEAIILTRAVGELKTRSEQHGFRGIAHVCSDLTAKINEQYRAQP